MESHDHDTIVRRPVRVPAGDVELDGWLVEPADARGVAVFCRALTAPRTSFVDKMTRALRRERMATLVLDLRKRDDGGDLDRLAERLVEATRWLVEPGYGALPVAWIGRGPGGAVALAAASGGAPGLSAVVAIDGHLDPVIDRLDRVQVPVLLVVGAHDRDAVAPNRAALGRIRGSAELQVVPGSMHEPGSDDEVGRRVARWLVGGRSGRAIADPPPDDLRPGM